MRTDLGTVAVGEAIVVTLVDEDEPRACTVLSRCEKDDGYEVCVTCDRILVDDIEKGRHLREAAEHRLAWVCLVHGPEIP